MFGHRKSPLNKIGKQNSVDPGFSDHSSPNPFSSDSEMDSKNAKASRRTSSEPSLVTPNLGTNPFDDNEVKGASSGSYSLMSSARNRYKNDFSDSGGLESQTVEELGNYAVYKAEETTKTVNGCLKIAEDMREDATKTLVMLNDQGEQISRTHMVAADMDYDLSRGEKLLGNLGSLFSKNWKPKRTRPVKGPVIMRDDPDQRRVDNLEHREKLGLAPAPRGWSSARTPLPESANALQKVEVEKEKQDDSLSEISNILGELKHMAVDMGSEIERQNKALDPMQDDVETLGIRMKGANQRARRLLGK